MLKEVLYDGRWGTIGPKFLLACEEVKAYTKNKHCILTLSPFAALEALMRSLDIGQGDKVLMASYGNPINPMVTRAIQAEAVFCDFDLNKGEVDIGDLTRKIEPSVKAILLDNMSRETQRELAAIVERHDLYLIENSGDLLDDKEYKVTARVIDLGSKRNLNSGLAGAILTDDDTTYIGAYAYHNCGRLVDQSDNLKVEDFVGGDMRIAEWQSVKILENLPLFKEKDSKEIAKKLSKPYFIPLRALSDRVLFKYDKEKNDNIPIDDFIVSVNGKRIYKAMHKEEFFKWPEKLENSLRAEESLVWVFKN